MCNCDNLERNSIHARKENFFNLHYPVLRKPTFRGFASISTAGTPPLAKTQELPDMTARANPPPPAASSVKKYMRRTAITRQAWPNMPSELQSRFAKFRASSLAAHKKADPFCHCYAGIEI